MDSTQLAAGSRIKNETFDQAPAQRTSNRTLNSNIFNNNVVDTQPAQRKMQQPKSDIFSTTHQVVQAPSTRNYQGSQIFSNDVSYPAQSTKNENLQTRSTVFATTAATDQEKKTTKGKNSENRAKDHGKDFLFGKADFNDYKSTLRRTQTVATFEPKVDYNPQNRLRQDLHGSSVFTGEAQKGPTQEKEVAQAINQGADQDADLDNIAKDKKTKNLQSNIFGAVREPKRRSTIQIEPASKQKEIDEKKKKNHLMSEVFGVKDVQPIKKQKDRLIASNQVWSQMDSVKHLKDFAPGEDQQGLELHTASQKKFQTLKSSMDTHNFQANEVVDKNERLSTKHLKFKGDVLSRETKPVQNVKKAAKKTVVKQDDNDSVI